MLTVTSDFVTGVLKQANSTDPDILRSSKQRLIQQQQPMLWGSMAFLVLGAIMTITIIGAIAGLPMLLLAGWVQWKARNNLKTIEAAFASFSASSAMR